MLDIIFEEVGKMVLDEESLKSEIMQRVKQYNYIEPSIEEALSKGILKAYRIFLEERK